MGEFLRQVSLGVTSKTHLGLGAAFVFVSLLVVRTGVWFMPNYSQSLSIINNPFESPPLPPEQQYIYGSWLIHFIGFLVGASSPWKFFLLNGFFTFCFLMVLFWIARRSAPHQMAPFLFGLLCLTPAASVAIFWVGMDGLTLLLMAVSIALLRHGLLWGLWVIGFLLGLQHSEMGVVAYLLFVVSLAIKRDWRTMKLALHVLAVLIVTKVVFEFVLSANQIEYLSRSEWLVENMGQSLAMFAWSPVAIIWSAMGALWITFVSKHHRVSVPRHVLVPVILALIPTMLSIDQTRTLAIVLFPVIAWHLVSDQELTLKLYQRLRMRGLVLLSIIPSVVVWQGQPYTSIFFEGIFFILNVIFGWMQLPPNPATWPFNN